MRTQRSSGPCRVSTGAPAGTTSPGSRWRTVTTPANGSGEDRVGERRLHALHRGFGLGRPRRARPPCARGAGRPPRGAAAHLAWRALARGHVERDLRLVERLAADGAALEQRDACGRGRARRPAAALRRRRGGPGLGDLFLARAAPPARRPGGRAASTWASACARRASSSARSSRASSSPAATLSPSRGDRETIRPGAWKPSWASVASTVPEATSAPSVGSGFLDM